MRRLALLALAVPLFLGACPSNEWVLKDPPQTCTMMCQKWGMELAAIVGVGDQSRVQAQGATACVCRPPQTAPATPEAGSDATVPSASALSPLEYEAAGYAAIPPEIRRREAEQKKRSDNIGSQSRR